MGCLSLEVGNILTCIYAGVIRDMKISWRVSQSTRENPLGRDRKSHQIPKHNSWLSLVSGISPAVHVVIVRTPYTHPFAMYYPHPVKWHILKLLLLFLTLWTYLVHFNPNLQRNTEENGGRGDIIVKIKAHELHTNIPTFKKKKMEKKFFWWVLKIWTVKNFLQIECHP